MTVDNMSPKNAETLSLQGLKQILRRRILERRSRVIAGLRGQYSAAIAQRILQLPEYRNAQTVLAYMHFGAEFESEIFVRQTLADGKTLLLPRVNTATRELELYRVEDVDAQLAPGAYGIREPVAESCVRVDAPQPDFILLPGVAFGCQGERLGYGGGFYDKLLAQLLAMQRPALVAGAFEMQVVADIPMEATDQRIDWLVTENETIRCVSD